MNLFRRGLLLMLTLEEHPIIAMPMKIYQQGEPDYVEFVKGLNRRALPALDLQATVAGLITQVREEGDAALARLGKQFDGVELSAEEFVVSPGELAEASSQVSTKTKEAIAAARENIHAFAQKSLRKDWEMLNKQGAKVGEFFVPYERVGVYVPGGKAPLVSTALMTAAFAQAAGVPEIVAATPCNKEGMVNPALLYALQEAGATKILKLGGVQGIAALALGTETICPVEKIVGPGNQYVVEAKRQLVGAVSIDLLPGPSEVLIIADESANPAFLAADLLAQAEHGGDSVVGLVTTSPELLSALEVEIEKQISTLSRKTIIEKVLEHAFCLVVDEVEEAVNLCNAFAPEHLSLVVKEPKTLLAQIKNVGAIYVGSYSPVAVGDFLAGPSHTLPTGGAAKSFSGLRADQFQRRISLVELTPEAVAASLPYVQEFANLEGLDAHGHSTSIRTL